MSWFDFIAEIQSVQ